LFKNKSLLYSYLFQILIKPLIESADEDVEILIDKRDVKGGSINSLADHIKIKAYSEWFFQHNISIKYIDSKQSKGIQMADLIANIVYSRYVTRKKFLYNMLIIKCSIRFPS
jgi:hypothetical protein